MKLEDERLAAWLEGDLPAEEAAKVAAFVAADPTAAARHQRLHAARDLVRRNATVRAPPGFAARLDDALDAVDATDVAPRRSWRSLAVAVAAGAAVVALGAFLGTGTPVPTTPEVAEAPSVTFRAGPTAGAPVPQGLRLVTPLPAEAVRAAVEATGARWEDAAGAVLVTIDATAVAGLERRLGELGTVQVLGPTTPRIGAVRLELRVSAE